MKKQILKEFEEKFNPKDDWGSLNLLKEKILECNNEVKDWLSKKIDEIQELETIYWQNETKIALQEERQRIIELLEDHYWDSFEQDRDLILKHIKDTIKKL
jgi:hypothetical protein